MAQLKVGCVAVIEHPPDSDKYVLVEETKPHKRGRLNLPGGGIDLNVRDGKPEWESIVKCPTREGREETGLKIKLTGLLGLYEYRRDGQLHLAFGATAVNGVMRESTKHPTVDAFPFDDVEAMHLNGRLRSDRVFELIEHYRSDVPMLPMENVHILGSDLILPKAQPRLAAPTELEAAAQLQP